MVSNPDSGKGIWIGILSAKKRFYILRNENYSNISFVLHMFFLHFLPGYIINIMFLPLFGLSGNGIAIIYLLFMVIKEISNANPDQLAKSGSSRI